MYIFYLTYFYQENIFWKSCGFENKYLKERLSMEILIYYYLVWRKIFLFIYLFLELQAWKMSFIAKANLSYYTSILSNIN